MLRMMIIGVGLNKVFQLKVDGVAFGLIPEYSQVKNALKEKEKVGTSDDDGFPGVPVFQSRSLILRSQSKSYRPVFFRKEDLESSLSRASREQNQLNPAFRPGDVQVAVLEEVIKGMKVGTVKGHIKSNFITNQVIIQIRKSFTCFLRGLRKRKQAWERETWLSRHRNFFQAQINNGLGSFSQSSTTLKSLQSHINVECQINEQLVGRALNIKVSKENISAEECNCFVNNISPICKE